MSHRSRLHSRRHELNRADIAPTPVLAEPGLDALPLADQAAGWVQPRTIGPEQLVPMLLRQGTRPQLQVGWTEAGVVTLFAAIGPIVIPFGFDVAAARQVLEALANAIDQADAIVHPIPDEEGPTDG